MSQRRREAKVNIAIVGLGFGSAFPAIYEDHPDVGIVGICDSNTDLLNEVGDRFGVDRRHTDVEEVLASCKYNAVQVVTPVLTHADLALQVLASGKHCACAVPMGTTLEELHAIVDAERDAGLVYMMMETAVYTHHFLYAKELHERGEFGRIQFLRAAYYQDMVGWPDYWRDLPPMHYATHAVAPLLAIANTSAKSVHCFGSGTIEDRVGPNSDSPFPVETAIYRLDTDRDMAMEITRSLFDTARVQMESFSIYGSLRSIEWQMADEPPVVFHMPGPLRDSGKGRAVNYERVVPSDTSALLPAEIRSHSWQKVVPDPQNPHLSVLRCSGHYGSHPHLVHEFVRSIIEGRRSVIDSVTAADWTAPGICAHQSALGNGREVEIPRFDR